MSKIFEIGMPKTGTTSLGVAYEILGFRHKGWSDDLHLIAYQGSEECGPDSPLSEGPGLEKVLTVIERYDAFQDGPWHNIDFRVLDDRFPGSKFILLDRDDDSWFRSMEYQFSIRYTRPWFSIRPEREYWVEVKKQRYEAAKAHFKDRPDALLVMNLSEGDGWEALCPFLGKPIPDVPFPKANRRPITEKKRLRRIVRERLGGLLRRVGLRRIDEDAKGL